MMICMICRGAEAVTLEPQLVIPCPVCCTQQAVDAVHRAGIIVGQCALVDESMLGAIDPDLAWVRCQTRPSVVYVTRYQLGRPVWSVSAEGQHDCWRANRGAARLADQDGRPHAFAGMEDAMQWCERAAAREAKNGGGT